MGLGKIFIFSVFSGLSLAFSYRISGAASDVGFAFVILDIINQSRDSGIQGMITIISIVVTIFFIYRLSVFFRQVYEGRLAGILTAVLGFSGSFLILSSPQQETHLIVLGGSLWVIGIIIASLGGKKHQKT